MSRIQDALDKLQQRGYGTYSPSGGTRSLGRIVDGAARAPLSRRGGAPEPHVYRQDRQLEIDRRALRRTGLLAPENQERRLSEEYRQIKRPLLAMAARGAAETTPRANLIMVGSAVPGEGKTFTAINLCLSLALEKDWSVVLVDGDVAKPHVTGLFGLEGEPGLMDLLRSQDTAFDELVLPTDVPGFAVMPAGRLEEHAFELLASARMDAIAQHLADADPYRLVVFDSPPLLATSEAPALAVHVGQVVLVVYAGHTPRQRVQQAIAKLDPAKAVNLILNQAELGGDTLAYGGQYGYGYHAEREHERQ